MHNKLPLRKNVCWLNTRQVTNVHFPIYLFDFFSTSLFKFTCLLLFLWHPLTIECIIIITHNFQLTNQPTPTNQPTNQLPTPRLVEFLWPHLDFMYHHILPYPILSYPISTTSTIVSSPSLSSFACDMRLDVIVAHQQNPRSVARAIACLVACIFI